MGRPGTAITFVSEWDFDMLDVIHAHIGDDLHPGRWPHEAPAQDTIPATATERAAV
jgi:superfamily II DNA/RNA helicase